jgi:hypothetical protein
MLWLPQVLPNADTVGAIVEVEAIEDGRSTAASVLFNASVADGENDGQPASTLSAMSIAMRAWVFSSTDFGALGDGRVHELRFCGEVGRVAARVL